MPPKPLIEIWNAGVDAVRGEASVSAALPSICRAPDQILAVGKAACDMARGALAVYPDTPALVLTKHHHCVELPGATKIIEAGHPIPDDASLVAGAAALDVVQNARITSHLLMLVSGGASAVAELLPTGMTLDQWRDETQTLVASGADIHAINARRKKISLIKGGKLLSNFNGNAVTCLAISDVEGDALDVIGSGIGMAPPAPKFDFKALIVASNSIARRAAAAAADAPVVTNSETLYGDIHALAPNLAATIKTGAPGIYIFGGEPTVKLPANPGRGGRNQALALLMAREIAGTQNIEILVAGTDGTDGPTEDAGALVDGQTWSDEAVKAIGAADSGAYLLGKNALVTTGPTGTNVMDLLIARKT